MIEELLFNAGIEGIVWIYKLGRANTEWPSEANLLRDTASPS